MVLVQNMKGESAKLEQYFFKSSKYIEERDYLKALMSLHPESQKQFKEEESLVSERISLSSNH
jgi:hypothetical protein